MALLLQYTIIYASVLLLVALGGCFSEWSGIINLGLAVSSKKPRAPKSEGIPYDKGQR